VARAAAWGGVLMAAACTMPPAPPIESAPPASVEAPVEEQRPVPPHPTRKPSAPVVAALPAPQDATPPASQNVTPPATTEAPGFDKLQGLDQAETTAFLGEPLQRAESPPAVLWRYASRDCALDVYFYLDLQSREMRVLHYEVRNTDGSERSQQRCYGELVTAHRAEQTGSSDRPR
jgi:hypothetical protein